MALTAALALSACGSLMPPPQVAMEVAPQWHAPLPHQGAVTSLTDWWQQQGDPVLVDLIGAAQQASPSVSQALTNATLPYAVKLATLGLDEALRKMPELQPGVNVIAGNVVHQAVADAHGLPFRPWEEGGGE